MTCPLIKPLLLLGLISIPIACGRPAPGAPLNDQQRHVFGFGSLAAIESLLAEHADLARVTPAWEPILLAARDNTSSEAIRYLSNFPGALAARNEEGEDPLLIAAKFNPSTAVVDELLKAGANPNTEDRNQRRPLSWVATLRSDPSFATLLLLAGAEIDHQEEWETAAIHWAASNPSVSILKTLLESGANPNQRGPREKTPLVYAIMRGSADHVRLLLEYGADPHLDYGYTGGILALVAISCESPSALRALLELDFSRYFRFDSVEDVHLSPLHDAVRFNQHQDVVRLFMDEAMKNHLSPEGVRFIVEEGRRNPNPEVHQLLEQYLHPSQIR